MATVTKSLDDADEVRSPTKTRVELVTLEGTTFARVTFQPGWRWSECVKPVAGTDSCQARHVGYAISGRLHVVADDGTEIDIAPGEASIIEPGHDAWVEGNEPYVGVEMSQAPITYAQASE